MRRSLWDQMIDHMTFSEFPCGKCSGMGGRILFQDGGPIPTWKTCIECRGVGFFERDRQAVEHRMARVTIWPVRQVLRRTYSLKRVARVWAFLVGIKDPKQARVLRAVVDDVF